MISIYKSQRKIFIIKMYIYETQMNIFLHYHKNGGEDTKTGRAKIENRTSTALIILRSDSLSQ